MYNSSRLALEFRITAKLVRKKHNYVTKEQKVVLQGEELSREKEVKWAIG